MNFFHHKDLGNHLLQLCPKVVKQPVCQSLDMRRIQCAVSQVLAVGGDGLRSSGVWRDVFWVLATDILKQLLGATAEGQAVQAQRHNTGTWSFLFAITRHDEQKFCALEGRRERRKEDI